MREVTLFAPCKINLTLGITGSRLDGYHLIHSVMQSIDYGDTVTISLTDNPKITLSCDDPIVPTDERNIAFKAAKAFLKANGRKQAGVHIDIVKRIPALAGLGSGSADGAAVLAGLNHLFGNPYTRSKLAEIGSTVGADLPFCIQGGTCLAEGIGEILTPLKPLPMCHFVLVRPEDGMSTAECFQRYDQNPPTTISTGRTLLAGLEERSLEKIGKGVYNVLEEATAMPDIVLLKQRLLESGALGASMTGSGSAVFGIFENAEQANICQDMFVSEGLWSVPAIPISHGVRIRAEN